MSHRIKRRRSSKSTNPQEPPLSNAAASVQATIPTDAVTMESKSSSTPGDSNVAVASSDQSSSGVVSTTPVPPDSTPVEESAAVSSRPSTEALDSQWFAEDSPERTALAATNAVEPPLGAAPVETFVQSSNEPPKASTAALHTSSPPPPLIIETPKEANSSEPPQPRPAILRSSTMPPPSHVAWSRHGLTPPLPLSLRPSHPAPSVTATPHASVPPPLHPPPQARPTFRRVTPPPPPVRSSTPPPIPVADQPSVSPNRSITPAPSRPPPRESTPAPTADRGSGRDETSAPDSGSPDTSEPPTVARVSSESPVPDAKADPSPSDAGLDGNYASPTETAPESSEGGVNSIPPLVATTPSTDAGNRIKAPQTSESSRPRARRPTALFVGLGALLALGAVVVVMRPLSPRRPSVALANPVAIAKAWVPAVKVAESPRRSLPDPAVVTTLQAAASDIAPMPLREANPNVESASAAGSESAMAAGAIPPGPASEDTVRVAINIRPEGARVFYRGKEVGRTPFTLELLRGERRVFEVGYPGYATRRLIIDGTEAMISFNLTPRSR